MDTEDTAHTEITAMLTWFKALRPFCISLRAKPHQYFWPCSIILLEYPVQFSQFNQLKTSKTCFRERQRYVFLTLCMWSAFVLARNINKVVTFNRSSQKLSQCTLDHAYGRQNSSWCPWGEASTWKKKLVRLCLEKQAHSSAAARACHTVWPQRGIIYGVARLQPDIPALRGELVVQNPIEIQVGKCLP